MNDENITRAMHRYLSKIGRKGGQATGARKARPTEHYRAAARKRWDAVKAKST